MLESYYINLYDCNGTFITTYDTFISIDFGRQKNDVGACNIKLPGSLIDLSFFEENCMIEIFRYNTVASQFTLIGDTVWIYQKLEYSHNGNNDDVLDITFYDTISVLKYRYNLWQLHATYSFINLDYPSHLIRAASDAILQLYNHNFGVNTAAPIASMYSDPPPAVVTAVGGIGASNRTLEAISPATLPATLDSPVIPFESDWKEILESMQALSNISENANVPLWFDIVYTASDTVGFGSLSFRIWENQRGVIKSDYVFGPEYGNLQNSKYVVDYTDKKDVIIAIADELLDSDPDIDEKVTGLAMRGSYTNCIFHGKEFVVEQRTTTDGTNGITDNAISSLAQSELNAHKGIRKVTGDLINIPGQEFFIDFNYGDIVAVEFFGNTFYAEINKFSVTVDSSGEKISIPIESTQLII